LVENDDATARADAAIAQARDTIVQSEAQLTGPRTITNAPQARTRHHVASTVEQRETAAKSAHALLAAAKNALSVAQAERDSRAAERLSCWCASPAPK